MCEPSCSLPKLDTFLFFLNSVVYFFNYYYYYLLENITKTRHTEVEGSHLVMNTEVSQESVLGQILGSEQMSIISGDGAG